MKTLAHLGQVLPLLAGTLAYYMGLGLWKQGRARANRPDPTLRAPDPDGPRPELEPYRPTPDDLREYAAWSATLPGLHPTFECPGDYGDYCEHCDREQAEAQAREHDNRSDGWYLDLLARADFPGFDPHDPERGV